MSSLKTPGVAALACALLAGAAAAQTTRPASQPAQRTQLSVDVWTCTAHEKLRMVARGKCPICEKDLVRQKVTIQGGETVGDPYPLETCPVSGLTLGEMGPPIVWIHEGREVRFCCTNCINKFEEEPSKFLEKADQRIIEQQLPYYPLTSCPVSGQALRSMGGPVDLVYNNRLVRFCCKGCVRGFKKDPGPTLAKLDDAVIAAQSEAYPFEACPISRQKLVSMGEPVDYIVGNRLVRFCCTGCIGRFYRAPAVHLAALNDAWPEPEPGRSQDE